MNRTPCGAPPGSCLTPLLRILPFLAGLALLTSAALVQAAGPRVGLYYAASDTAAPPEVKAGLDALKVFDKVDLLDNSVVNTFNNPNVLQVLQQYDAVVIIGDAVRTFSDPTGMGNIFNQYADSGGGVVVANPYVVTSSGITGSFYTRYALVDQTFLTSFAGLTITNKQAHPILNNINTISTVSGRRCVYVRPTLRAGTTTLATWSDGTPMVLIGTPQGRLRVDLNLITASWLTTYGCHDPADDTYKLIANAINFVANPLRAVPSTVDFGDVGVNVLSTAQTVQVTNTSSAPITLSVGALSGPEFVVSNITLPSTLAAGASLSFDLAVRPNTLGTRTGSYTLTPSNGGPPLAVSMRATGIGPRFAATPAMIDFGGVKFGTPISPVSVLLRNDGGGDLRLSALTLTDTTNFALENAPTLPNTLRGGGVQSVDVRFRPQSQGRFTGNLQVTYQLLPSLTNYTGVISLVGSAGDPAISVPLGTVTLATARVMRCGAVNTIVVTNNGFARLNISNIEAKDLAGMATSEFKIATTSAQVGPNGGTWDLPVQFCPSTTGKRVANLVITSDDANSPTTIRVEAIGTTATINLSSTALSYAQTALGSCATSQDITVTNGGTDNLVLSSMKFDGAGAASYRLIPPFTTNRVIPAMGRGTITVAFCPTDVGAQPARLLVTSDLPSTNEVALSGSGTGPKATATPATVDFGNVYIRTLSAEQAVVLKNSGDKPLVLGKAVINPAGTTFPAGGLPVEGTQIAPGDSLTIKLRANPQVGGMAAASLDIPVNDLLVMGTLRVPLKVVGVQANITVDPKQINFGTGNVGASSPPRNLTISNPGDSPLTGLTLALMGATGDFATDMPGDMIPPKGSLTVKVYFRPMLTDSRMATLTINAVGLQAPEVVALLGTGVVPSVTCTKTSLDFGSVPLNMESPKELVCTNQDASALDLSAALDKDTDYVVTNDPAMLTIPGAVNGEPGTLVFNVVFKPTASGTRTAALTVRGKGSDFALATVDLTGVGLPPRPSDKMGCSYGGGAPLAGGSGALGLFAALGLWLGRRRR